MAAKLPAFTMRMGHFMLKSATMFAIGLTGSLFVENYVMTMVFIEGSSMKPTLNPEPLEYGDLCLIWKWRYKPKRGDIVCLKSPAKFDGKVVKRIVALEGDKVTPRILYNEYLSDDKPKDVIIPKGTVWVEGDLGEQSYDSNSYGPILTSNIIGKVTRVIIPQKVTKQRNYFMKLNSFIPEPYRIKTKDS